LPETKRILVADDADAVTTVITTALEINGFDVTATDNGNHALELATTEHFDLAIIDQLMSGMLGIDVLKRLRMEGNELPVIILSGVDGADIVVDSFQSGAADFIRKPFRLPELLARMEKHLSTGSAKTST
jgi:DNA-binding response OmpR family regulator